MSKRMARLGPAFVAGTLMLAGRPCSGWPDAPRSAGPGRPASVRLQAAAENLPGQSPGEPAAKEAFVVLGKVTDAQGQPMPGVEVWVSTGMGTLFRTGQTTTDANGRYRLAFRAGYGMQRGENAPLGVGFQAATVTARKPGYFIAGLGRAGNLAMTDQTNKLPAWATNFAGVVRAFQPYSLDFVLEPAATLKGELVDPGGRLPPLRSLSLKGEKLPPSCSVLAYTNLASSGRYEFADVPVGFDWWLEVEWRQGEAWKRARSKTFSLRSPKEHHLNVTLTGQDTLEMSEIAQ